MSFGFDRPLLVIAAVISIPVLLFISHRLKPLFALDLPLGPPGGIAFKSPIDLKFLMRLLRALEMAGVLLLFLAAAGPHMVFKETIWLNRGADIIFVLDISPSMAGIDMNGINRFDAARVLLNDFAARRPQDSIGLVALGEDASLLLPLTTDRESLYNRLDTLSIGELGDGTALGTGLALAAFHIGKSGAPRRAVVLITDGENNAGSIHPETAAAMLGDLGVTLWVIGVGSSGEIPLSYVDPVTGMLRAGTFESRYDPETLKQIALSGRGYWIHAAQADAFAAAFSQIDQGEMIVRRSSTQRREEALYSFFLIAAGAILWGVRLVRRQVLGALL
ncbi:MAG: VWA domain-containing protein [Treponema sp.]|jgi:Ca-activated chloride channel family protein|nr:VWA domain-containing protein [Treponema sp.]